MDGFLLPLIGKQRLNLVFKPKRCPRADIRHKAHLIALMLSDSNRIACKCRRRIGRRQRGGDDRGNI